MNVRIRKGKNEDLEGIYECHLKCFEKGDVWYKSFIQQSLNLSFVVERTDNNQIIGVMLQSKITPCDPSDEPNFVSISEMGDAFKENKLYFDSIPGITMLCIDPEYRGKGLAKKLIELHFKHNQNRYVCLNTRKSNPAFHLYIKMGYEHIANIKNKYFQPNEDSCFMIKKVD